MTINTNREGDTLTLSVAGNLSTPTAPELDAALKANIDGVKTLVFDLGKLEYMASAGLRVLMTAAKTMHKQGSMKVINVPQQIMDVFAITGLTEVLDITPL